MSSEALANIIEGHHAAHLHCHVLIDPLAIAGRSDHALLAQLREALGEAALTRVHRLIWPMHPTCTRYWYAWPHPERCPAARCWS